MLPLLFALLLSIQLVAAGDAAPFARQPSVATSKGLSQLSVRNPKFAPRDYVCPVNYCEMGGFFFIFMTVQTIPPYALRTVVLAVMMYQPVHPAPTAAMTPKAIPGFYPPLCRERKVIHYGIRMKATYWQ
ncbi:hypothetical protein OG21DRAFT_1606549 [Imleria badia]|nr:hypothetical protein OG21DRAFT_1606549 [Imleria badia]